MILRALLLLSFFLASTSAFAQYRGPVERWSRSPVHLSVVDRETGREAEVYRHHADQWIAGEPGHRYALRLRNNSSERVLAVVSVDGVNVVSGKTASIDQGGYVLNPYQTVDITGWRKSYSSVAAFVFSSPYDSYAARTGRPGNVGVIGVAVFRELRRPPPVIIHEEVAGNRSADAAGAPAPASAPSVARQKQSQELGTAHGDRESSWASRTTFERESTYPVQSISVRYDSYSSLVSRGVIRRWEHYERRSPEPFPSSGFVPDP